MIFSFFKTSLLSGSQLYNEKTFYKQFLKDISQAYNLVQIESPFITATRMELFIPIFQGLLDKGIQVKIITRDPAEHDEVIRYQATEAILFCKDMGVEITLLNGYHHRKLAIIDDQILWEGSLNILSQSRSTEVMRRIQNKEEVAKMRAFLGY